MDRCVSRMAHVRHISPMECVRVRARISRSRQAARLSRPPPGSEFLSDAHMQQATTAIFFPLLRFFVPDSSSAFRSCSFSGKTACHPSRSLDWERSSLVRPRPALPSSRFPLVYVEAVSLSLARSLGRSSFLLLHCAVAILNFLVPLPCFLPPHHPPSLCILLSSSASSFSSCRA